MDLWKEIRELHFFWEDEKDLINYSKMCVPEIKRVLFIYVLSLSISGSAWLFVPSVNHSAHQEKGHTKMSQLPYLGWYPLNVENEIYFYLLYVHQIIVLTLVGIASHGCKLLLLTLIVFVSKLLAYFNKKLRNVPKAENLTSSVEGCAKIKSKIQVFLQQIHGTFLKLAFLHLTELTIMFVIAAFRMTDPQNTFWQKVILMHGVSTQLLYFYLLCSYGSEIINQCHKGSNIIYFWPWENWKLKDIEMMQMMATINQRPLKLKAGLYTLSLEFFLTASGIAATSFLLLINVRDHHIE
ncbi:uncharacterized protein LOC135939846 isoform X2 [Cloeon dipterum]|uniref:uncharacterized protein LOC135939846 isoform X2 n=1 Tax=Cloeon dipterum TaxID=197152 RepID=UPI00321FB227